MASFTTLVLCKFCYTAWNYLFHGASQVALMGVVASLFLLFAALLLFIIQGFRTHWAWGLAILLAPCAVLGFVFMHPRKAMAPVIILFSGLALLLLMNFMGLR